MGCSTKHFCVIQWIGANLWPSICNVQRAAARDGACMSFELLQSQHLMYSNAHMSKK